MCDYTIWGRVVSNCEKYGAGYVKRGCYSKPTWGSDPAVKTDPISYDVKAVLDMADTYITASYDYYRAARYNLTDHESKVVYWERNAEESMAYSGLKLMCQAVGADVEAVLAIAKCFRRYSQYRRNWDFLPERSMEGKEKDGFRRCVQA